jgi:hypothetical protein
MADPTSPPDSDSDAPAETHFECVQARRTDADGEQLLEEALERLRIRRANRVPRLIVGL